jgi:hypothetical protein
MKKPIFLSLALTVAFSTGCQASATPVNAPLAKAANIQFTDLANHWAKDSITKAIQQGYVDGYDDLTFKPEQQVSRAEFLKMTATALKLPVTGDTTGAKWYKPYMDAAKAKGILLDSDFAEADINNPISRIEMARISVRATSLNTTSTSGQTDDNSIMYSATKAGLIQGLSKGELAPTAPTTRAQSVTIVDRILTENAGGKLVVDKYAVSNADLALNHTNIFDVMPEIFGGYQTEPWDTKKLVVETGDGLYKATMDDIVAIDLEDPNDPNLGLLGDMDKLKWFNGRSFANSPLVKDGFMKSYALYFKGHVDYNNDTEVYGDNLKQPNFSIYGFSNGALVDPDNNILSSTAHLINNNLDDVPAMIIPKTGIIGNFVAINLSAPARPPHQNYTKQIFASAVSKK